MTCSVTISDVAGNSKVCTSSSVSNIDRVNPTGIISYSTTNWTNQDVEATLSLSEEVQAIV